MNIALLENELNSQNIFSNAIKEIPEYSNTTIFNSISHTKESARENLFDMIIINVEIPNVDISELFKELKHINKDMVIVFAVESFSALTNFLYLYPDYYILKPFTKHSLQEILWRAKCLLRKPTDLNVLKVVTFGQFEVFYNSRPLSFNGKKTKELFALLINKHGQILKSEEAFSCLYEGKEYNRSNMSAYYKIVKRLHDYLASIGLSDVLKIQNGSLYLNCENIQCDYFDFLKRNRNAIESFVGIYMSDYWWGEDTIGTLLQLKDNYYEFNIINKI